MFNKETEYAIRGLVYIQTQNQHQLRPGIDEIAREIDAPRFYTAKIMQRLVKQGFLTSQKGKGGGFQLPIGKSELTLKDVIVSIEGDQLLTGCGFGLADCNCESPCPLHDNYAGIRTAIDTLVSTETIRSLAEKSQNPTE